MSKEITGALFKQMILHGAAAITAQKQAINDLNVFPVPDGDTGTNMSMTIATAAEALRKAAPASVGQASSVTASALLQGARGNSGVILSLLFRGLSKALKGMETADAAAFAAAMQEGVAAAYKAVMKPAEGHGADGFPSRCQAGCGHCRRGCRRGDHLSRCHRGGL